MTTDYRDKQITTNKNPHRGESLFLPQFVTTCKIDDSISGSPIHYTTHPHLGSKTNGWAKTWKCQVLNLRTLNQSLSLKS